ncbi:MAG TPA: histidine kinase [Jatrophihabitans sp.]|jgi:signal transduction histidine kinase
MNSGPDASTAEQPPAAAVLAFGLDPRDVDWTVLAEPGVAGATVDKPLSVRRIVLQLTLAGLVILTLVGIAGAAVSQRLAERQSVHDAAQITDVLAESVFEPALTDQAGTNPAVATKLLDPIVRHGTLSESLVRVKVWTARGEILYSDEPRLIGSSYPLDDEAQMSLTRSRTTASVSDLRRPENQYERSAGKLLEVYRPVWTPAGEPLLLETYFKYDTVTARSSDLWRGFFGITLSSLAAAFVLIIPLLWTLIGRVRRAERRRAALIQRSLEASNEERRRIAGDLHDGVVQQLAATSFTVAAAAERARTSGDKELSASLDAAAATVRSTSSELRSLLVDIYPPNLATAGLTAALHDLVATTAGGGPRVSVQVEPGVEARLSEEAAKAVYRVAQEALRNAVRHAHASTVSIALASRGELVRLEVSDDGDGFRPSTETADGIGHFGIQLMTDVARRSDSLLAIGSRSGGGTTVRMDAGTR